MKSIKKLSNDNRWGKVDLATCSTCPDGEAYDPFRNASHDFTYDEATGIVYNSTGGAENGDDEVDTAGRLIWFLVQQELFS